MSRIQILERQIKDLKIRLENMAPKHEMKQKDETIRMLQKNIRTLEEGIEERINAAVAKAVAETATPLIEELSKAHAEISRLKSILNKDSSNSSKPPSTNGFKAIPNNREKSELKQGGQKGHPGHRLRLPENMKELEAKGVLEKRTQYHTDEPINGNWSYISRYTIDVETKIIITEHRYKYYWDIPPEQYNEVSYGENIKANVVLLSNEGIIANKRLSEIISSMTHGEVKMSTGTIDKILSDFGKNLTESGELEAIKEDLLNGEVMNTDDTQIRTPERIVYSEEKNASPTYEKAEKKSFRATARTHARH